MTKDSYPPKFDCWMYIGEMKIHIRCDERGGWALKGKGYQCRRREVLIRYIQQFEKQAYEIIKRERA